MAESTQIVFKHTELVEALVKHQGIHEGIWGLFVKFGLQAVNVGASESDLMPAALIAMLEVGLQKFDKENNIAVDAAKVNPKGLPLVSEAKKVIA